MSSVEASAASTKAGTAGLVIGAPVANTPTATATAGSHTLPSRIPGVIRLAVPFRTNGRHHPIDLAIARPGSATYRRSRGALQTLLSDPHPPPGRRATTDGPSAVRLRDRSRRECGSQHASVGPTPRPSGCPKPSCVRDRGSGRRRGRRRGEPRARYHARERRTRRAGRAFGLGGRTRPGRDARRRCFDLTRFVA